jgi:hypothetical protein
MCGCNDNIVIVLRAPRDMRPVYRHAAARVNKKSTVAGAPLASLHIPIYKTREIDHSSWQKHPNPTA